MRKKFFIAMTVIFTLASVSTSFFIESSQNRTQAAIAVIDTQNIAKAQAEYVEAAKTVQNTLTQIENQIKELASLPGQVISQFSNQLTQEIGAVTNEIKKAESELLKPATDAEASWRNIFTKVESWGNPQINILATDQGVILKIDTVNKDAFKIIKANNITLEVDLQRLADLMDLNASAEGNKQAAQINNMLQAQANGLKARELAIKQAVATATMVYYQRQNQIDAQAADRAQQIVNQMEAVKSKGNPFAQSEAVSFEQGNPFAPRGR